MSGHSKWATIKRKKGAADAKRGQMFTKLAREIQLAARQGPDTNFNFRLRLIVEKARAENMPKENIERAIKRGAGLDSEGGQLEERNRTAALVRSTFSKHGGNLGESGCVAWLFERRGLLQVAQEGVDEESLLMAALEAGALDMKASDEVFEVLSEPADLHAVKDAVEAAGFSIDEVEITQIPKTAVEVGRSEAPQVLRLMEALEDLDDVQNVYANFDIPAEVLEEIQAESR